MGRLSQALILLAALAWTPAAAQAPDKILGTDASDAYTLFEPDAAVTAGLPSQSGQGGNCLKTTGTALAWGTCGGSGLTDSQVGDKAFKNPPAGLSDAQEKAVRDAIDAPSTALAREGVLEIASRDNETLAVTLLRAETADGVVAEGTKYYLTGALVTHRGKVIRRNGTALPEGISTGDFQTNFATYWEVILDPGLADGSVTHSKLAADAVEADNIKAGAVGSAKLANAVRSQLLPTLPNTGSRNDKVLKFAGNTLGWEADATGGTTLADGSVTTAKLAADAVTGAKLADGAVGQEHLKNASVSASKLSSAVTTTMGRIPTAPGNSNNNRVWKTDGSGTPGWRVDATASGGSGLSQVNTDSTLTGDGTSGDALKVANPFTDADETKLDGIAAGAEVNVHANWDQLSSTDDSYIANKPSNADIGDIAFSNPPSDLDDTEKAAVRAAIGAGTGSGSSDQPRINDLVPQSITAALASNATIARGAKRAINVTAVGSEAAYATAANDKLVLQPGVYVLYGDIEYAVTDRAGGRFEASGTNVAELWYDNPYVRAVGDTYRRHVAFRVAAADTEVTLSLKNESLTPTGSFITQTITPASVSGLHVVPLGAAGLTGPQGPKGEPGEEGGRLAFEQVGQQTDFNYGVNQRFGDTEIDLPSAAGLYGISFYARDKVHLFALDTLSAIPSTTTASSANRGGEALRFALNTVGQTGYLGRNTDTGKLRAAIQPQTSYTSDQTVTLYRIGAGVSDARLTVNPSETIEYRTATHDIILRAPSAKGAVWGNPANLEDTDEAVAMAIREVSSIDTRDLSTKPYAYDITYDSESVYFDPPNGNVVPHGWQAPSNGYDSSKPRLVWQTKNDTSAFYVQATDFTAANAGTTTRRFRVKLDMDVNETPWRDGDPESTLTAHVVVSGPHITVDGISAENPDEEDPDGHRVYKHTWRASQITDHSGEHRFNWTFDVNLSAAPDGNQWFYIKFEPKNFIGHLQINDLKLEVSLPFFGHLPLRDVPAAGRGGNPTFDLSALGGGPATKQLALATRNAGAQTNDTNASLTVDSTAGELIADRDLASVDLWLRKTAGQNENRNAYVGLVTWHPLLIRPYIVTGGYTRAGSGQPDPWGDGTGFHAHVPAVIQGQKFAVVTSGTFTWADLGQPIVRWDANRHAGDKLTTIQTPGMIDTYRQAIDGNGRDTTAFSITGGPNEPSELARWMNLRLISAHHRDADPPTEIMESAVSISPNFRLPPFDTNDATTEARWLGPFTCWYGTTGQSHSTVMLRLWRGVDGPIKATIWSADAANQGRGCGLIAVEIDYII